MDFSIILNQYHMMKYDMVTGAQNSFLRKFNIAELIRLNQYHMMKYGKMMFYFRACSEITVTF